MNNKFNIQINSLSNVSLNFKNAMLYLNISEFGEWITIKNDSIASYEMTLIKIKSNNKPDFYLFIENANIVVENDCIIINTFSNIKLMVSDKNNFEKNRFKNELKAINAQINYLSASQNIGIKLDEVAKLYELKQKKFEVQMLLEFSLIEYEGVYNE
ncbi:hypothetical protein NXS15_00120 [Mycoplasma sp. CSL7475-4]|uniref:MSC_0621 family F1-like ATPase epsilon subunit n=1 Tax=Mycoplasma sp. CSL7475-4 TaxID=2973942 RepID=UPI00216B553D|nr:hypothetical protein [Mycoplasma sp. CSL7475-4]MCS4536538.1 hypothetical protein [Mycoplasma sp. CSL7475-4]